MLTEYLRDMFGGELPTVVADADVVSQWAAATGLPFDHIDEAVAEVPAAALVVLTSDQNYSAQGRLSDSFTNSRALWFPVAAFDGSHEAVSYGLRHLENMDFMAMIHGHQAALKLVEETSQVSFEGSRGTDIEIRFGSEVEFTMLQDLQVPVGGQSALASFFEFETEMDMEQLTNGESLAFVANGILQPSGILCAYGPGSYYADHEMVRRARQLARRAAAAHTTVEISASVVRRIAMDADDITEEFRALTGPCGLHVTEFAIGFYRAPDGSLDWRINSPVNEGVQGIHLGMGDGSSGIHFDFVCNDVISA